MLQSKRVFEAGSPEWKDVTIGSADGVAVVGAIGLAFRNANREGRLDIRTKGGESYAVHPQNVDLAPGLVLLELAARSDPHAPGFRPVTAAIPFSAVDSVTYERPEQ